jgi:hypothetical protein
MVSACGDGRRFDECKRTGSEGWYSGCLSLGFGCGGRFRKRQPGAHSFYMWNGDWRLFGNHGGSSNFSAVLGSTITFDWSVSFEQDSEGYAFAVLDGQKTILQQQFSSQIESFNTSVLFVNNTQLTIESSGLHTFSLGVVEGCTECSGLTSVLDPAAAYSSIVLADPAGVPEPAAMSLMGLGIGGILAGVLRRRRS